VASIQDFFNVRANRGPTPGDTTHRFIMDWVYEVPASLNLGNTVLNRLFGGWGVSGILNAQTGAPVYISQTGLYSRPDYVGGDPINPNYMHDGIYLNRSAFKLVSLGAGGNPICLGTLGNNAVRGPGSWGIDVGLGKTIAITERINLRFRAEAFNLLNHTLYSAFTAGINSANFGKFTGFTASRQVQLNARLTW
jgi:hypothetical protein